MSTKYTFSIADDFPNARVNPSTLQDQVRASAIVTALDFIGTEGDACDIWFKADLSGGDQTLLASVVAAHDGAETPDAPRVQLTDRNGAPLPLATDGKLFVLPNIFPGECILTFSGAEDSETTPLEGALFGLQAAPEDSAEQVWSFIDGVYISGGHIEWEGGSFGSQLEFEIWTTASTTKAPAVANQGNCNRVATGLGFDIIVPAAGNGAYDLDSACPVPAYANETEEQTGYWECEDLWIGRGTMSPGVPQHAKYNLFTAPLEAAHLCRLHLMKDSGSRDVVLPNIKPKWLLPHWRLKAIITNASTTKTLSVAWDLEIARRRSA